MRTRAKASSARAWSSGAHGAIDFTLKQGITALGFGLRAERQRQGHRQSARRLDQIARRAAFELQFEFRNRHGGPGFGTQGLDRASVERSFDRDAAFRGQRQLGAPNIGGKKRNQTILVVDRLEIATQFAVLDGIQCQFARRQIHIPFPARGNARVASRFDRLHETLAILADAQNQSPVAQREIRRVEIHRPQVLDLKPPAAREFPQRRQTANSLERVLGTQEFEFNFLGHGALVQSHPVLHECAAPYFPKS